MFCAPYEEKDSHISLKFRQWISYLIDTNMREALFRYIICAVSVSLLLTGCFDQGGGEEEEASSEVKKPKKESSSSSKGKSDEPEMSWSDLLKEKRALESQIKKIEKSQESSGDIKKEELDALQELEEVRTYLSNAQKLNDNVTSALNHWQEATRKSFEGVRLSEIVTISGESYKDVTITGVGDEKISISHSGGNTELEITSLSLGLRRNLIHEPTVLAEKGL